VLLSQDFLDREFSKTREKESKAGKAVSELRIFLKYVNSIETSCAQIEEEACGQTKTGLVVT
jgi:hypothetical protein